MASGMADAYTIYMTVEHLYLYMAASVPSSTYLRHEVHRVLMAAVMSDGLHGGTAEGLGVGLRHLPIQDGSAAA